MSALQASRQFKVPSRTLYDKVKKMGIVGARPMNRAIKRSPSNNGSPAAFPYGISGTRSPLAHQLEGQSHLRTLADGENGGELEQRERERDLLHSMAMMDPSLLLKAISGSGAAALAAANGFKNMARQSSQSPPPVYQGSSSAAPASPQRSIHDDDEEEEEPR